MFFAPAASTVVTACISHSGVLLVTLQLRPLKGRILPNKPWDDQVLLPVCQAVVMIGHWTTEQEKKTLQWSATLVT